MGNIVRGTYKIFINIPPPLLLLLLLLLLLCIPSIIS